MARAGRRYANVPIIKRGSLQDAPVLTTPPAVVVVPPADRRRYAGRVTVITGRAAPVTPPASSGLLMVMGM